MPHWLPRWICVGSIHGRRDVATHQRRLFVNRTRGCRDISSSKVSRGRVVSSRAAHIQLFSVIYERTSLPASLSAHNNSCCARNSSDNDSSGVIAGVVHKFTAVFFFRNTYIVRGQNPVPANKIIVFYTFMYC